MEQVLATCNGENARESEIGRTFGRLTVIEEAGNYTDRSGKSYPRFKCECSCGKTIIVLKASLKSGNTRSCGCIKNKWLVGQVFGRLKVTSIGENCNLSCGKKFRTWKCKCECGKEIVVSTSKLIAGRVKSCGCLRSEVQSKRNWKGYEEISGNFWRQIRKSANDRGIDFNLSVEYAWDLFLKQGRRCALSGRQLTFVPRPKFDNISIVEQTASLDRIDSSKGYVIGNVQWVHKRFNLMKLDDSEDEFVAYCKEIADYQAKKEKQIKDGNVQ